MYLSFLSLTWQYRYATEQDWLLLVLGAVGALANGSAWPILYLFLGLMLDDFIMFNTANVTLTDFDNVTMHTTRTLLQFSGANEDVLIVSDTFEQGVQESCIRFALVGLSVMISSYIQVSSVNTPWASSKELPYKVSLKIHGL